MMIRKIIAALVLIFVVSVFGWSQEQRLQPAALPAPSPNSIAPKFYFLPPVEANKKFSLFPSPGATDSFGIDRFRLFQSQRQLSTISVVKGISLVIEQQNDLPTQRMQSGQVWRQNQARYRAHFLFRAGNLQLSPRFSFQHERDNRTNKGFRISGGVRIFF